MTDFAKSFALVFRGSPHGNVHGQEALDIMAIATAFEQSVNLAFIDDGVLQLAKGQRTEQIDQKNYPKAFHTLADFGVNEVWVEHESLLARGLSAIDLMPLVDESTIPPTPMINILTRSEMQEKLHHCDVLLPVK